MITTLNLFRAFIFQLHSMEFGGAFNFQLHSMVLGGAFIVLNIYTWRVRNLRMKRIQEIVASYPDPTLPLRDIKVAREVAMVTRQLDFTNLYGLVNEFAGFKAVSSPSMARILVSTKQCVTPSRKRQVDEEIFHSEIGEIHARHVLRELRDGHPNPEEDERDEQRAKNAIAKINYMHAFYPIRDDDILFNTGVFTVDIISFINTYGWRKLEKIEEYAIFAYWRHLGYELGLKYIPETLEEMAEWTEKYAEDNLTDFCRASSIVNNARIGDILHNLPTFTHPFLTNAIYGCVSPSVRYVNGWSSLGTGSFATSMCIAYLNIHNLITYNFVMPRKVPAITSTLESNKKTGRFMPSCPRLQEYYPQGYDIHNMGPNKFRGCPFGMEPASKAKNGGSSL